MRAKEVLKILRYTRMTLHRYVQEGKIRVTKLPNGYYEYNDEDVYKFINKDIRRQTVEIVSLLHSYSMKLYSKRHVNRKKIEIESHDQEIEIL